MEVSPGEVVFLWDDDDRLRFAARGLVDASRVVINDPRRLDAFELSVTVETRGTTVMWETDADDYPVARLLTPWAAPRPASSRITLLYAPPRGRYRYGCSNVATTRTSDSS
jgi:hypothetical protein